ncbi:MAG: hypothetical protein HY288_12270 [Planctomycetia bacterium]|nr:hypothetical protein [Planctomycetia bacterium]
MSKKLFTSDSQRRSHRPCVLSFVRCYGSWILIITRALPVLAEAAVLLMGATQLAWRQFLPAVMLSNLGIAAVYSVLGQLAQAQGELPLALGASIALPLAAATIARRWMR